MASSLVGYATLQLIPSLAGVGLAVRQQLGGELGGVGRPAGEKVGEDVSDGLLGKVKGGALLAGAALGTGLIATALSSMNTEKVTDKLAGQLRLAGPAAEAAGEVAGKLYTGAYADSVEDGAAIVKAVSQNIGTDLNSTDFAPLAKKVADVANTFEQDLGGTTTAVGQLIKTGLAKDATDALNIITAGLQGPADRAGDLLDTFTEYPALFQRLGIDGATSLGIIEQGLAAGARNSDLIADALKEFQIRATDGSKLSAEGFAALGLSAEKLTAQIAAGGEGASAGLELVLDRLREIEDPVERNAAAVALFGTQAEDLGAALFALDPSAAAAGLGDLTGRVEELGDTVGGNAMTNLVSFGREIKTGFVDVLGGLIVPAITGAQEQLSTAFSGLSIDWAAVGTTLSTGVENAVAPILSGISTALATGDTAGLGEALGGAIANALNGLTDISATLGTSLSTAIGGVDWPSLAVQLGEQVPALLLGFVIGLSAFDIGAVWNVLTENWLAVLLGVLSIVFLPAKFIGPLASILGKIPFVGKFLEAALKWLNDLGGKITADFLRPLFDNLADGFRAAAPAFGRGFTEFLSLAVLQARIWADDVLVFFRAIPGRIGGALNGLAAEVGARIGQMVFFAAQLLREGAAQFVARFGADILQLGAAAARGGKALLDALLFVPRQVVNIGGDIIAGLVRGLANGTGALVTKAKEIAGKITSTIKGALGIRSPSRVMIEVGQFINEGLVIGLTDGAKDVESATKKIADNIYKGFKEIVGAEIDAQVAGIDASVAALKRQVEGLSKTAEARKKNAAQLARLNEQIESLNTQRKTLNESVEDIVNTRSQALLTSIASQSEALSDIATQREALAEEIKEATKGLEQAIKLRDDFAASIADQALKLGSLTGIAGSAKENDVVDAGFLLDGLREANTAAATFDELLERLANSAASDDVFRQIASAGVEQGSALARALLEGGDAAIKEANELTEKLRLRSEALGKATGEHLFDAGVESAQGLLDGLTSKEQALLDKATEIAQGIADRIRKALDIRSPSRVMATIGGQIGAGLVKGIDATRSAVGAAVDALVPLPRAASSSAVGAVVNGTRPGGGATVTLHQTNYPTSEVDVDLLARRSAFEIAGSLS